MIRHICFKQIKNEMGEGRREGHEAHSSQLGQTVGASKLCVACVKFM